MLQRPAVEEDARLAVQAGHVDAALVLVVQVDITPASILAPHALHSHLRPIASQLPRAMGCEPPYSWQDWPACMPLTLW